MWIVRYINKVLQVKVLSLKPLFQWCILDKKSIGGVFYSYLDTIVLYLKWFSIVNVM